MGSNNVFWICFLHKCKVHPRSKCACLPCKKVVEVILQMGKGEKTFQKNFQWKENKIENIHWFFRPFCWGKTVFSNGKQLRMHWYMHTYKTNPISSLILFICVLSLSLFPVVSQLDATFALTYQKRIFSMNAAKTLNVLHKQIVQYVKGIYSYDQLKIEIDSRPCVLIHIHTNYIYHVKEGAALNLSCSALIFFSIPSV